MKSTMNAVVCPFCDKGRIRFVDVQFSDGSSVHAQCLGCNASGPPGEDRVRALCLWNERAVTENKDDELLKQAMKLMVEIMKRWE